MSNSPKVRITKRDLQYWYNVGEEYDVEEWDKDFYVVSEDLKDDAREFRVIDKDNCEVIE